MRSLFKGWANVPVSEAEAAYWDRELDRILKIAVWSVVIIMGGGLGGALLGWLAWSVPQFAPLTLAALAGLAAGLAWALWRLLEGERSLAAVLLAALVVLCIIAGFEGAQYRLFIHQLGSEITARLAAELTVVTPVELPGLIKIVLTRRTGRGGLVGYYLLRWHSAGPAFLVAWAARVSWTAAAALVVMRVPWVSAGKQNDVQK